MAGRPSTYGAPSTWVSTTKLGASMRFVETAYANGTDDPVITSGPMPDAKTPATMVAAAVVVTVAAMAVPISTVEVEVVVAGRTMMAVAATVTTVSDEACAVVGTVS